MLMLMLMRMRMLMISQYVCFSGETKPNKINSRQNEVKIRLEAPTHRHMAHIYMLHK